MKERIKKLISPVNILLAVVILPVVASLVSENINGFFNNYIIPKLLTLLGGSIGVEILIAFFVMFVLYITLSSIYHIIGRYLNNKVTLRIYILSIVLVALLLEFYVGTKISKRLEAINQASITNKQFIEQSYSDSFELYFNSYGCIKAFPYISCELDIENKTDEPKQISIKRGNATIYNEEGTAIKAFKLSSLNKHEDYGIDAKILGNSRYKFYIQFEDFTHSTNKPKLLELRIHNNPIVNDKYVKLDADIDFKNL